MDSQELLAYYFSRTFYAGALLYILRWENTGKSLLLLALALPILIFITTYPAMLLTGLIGWIFKPNIGFGYLFGLAFAFTAIAFAVYRHMNPPDKNIRTEIKNIITTLKNLYYEYDIDHLILNNSLEDVGNFLYKRLKSGYENKGVHIIGFIILYSIAYLYIDWVEYFSEQSTYGGISVIFSHSTIINIILFIAFLYAYIKYYDFVESSIYTKFLATIVLLADRQKSIVLINRGDLLQCKTNDLLPQKNKSRYYQFRQLRGLERVYEINSFVNYKHFKEACSAINRVKVEGYFTEIVAMIPTPEKDKE